jgi:hypothetical protein
MDQMKQFDEIAKTFEQKLAGNTEALEALNLARAFFAQHCNEYKQPTLAGTLSCMWYCFQGPKDTMLRNCLGAIQRVAKGATFKN